MERSTLREPQAGGAEAECPVEMAIRTIGGKSKLMILRVLLLEGAKRFNALLRALEGMSAKVLTQNLRELEREGVVRRRVLSAAPLRVEYSMTPVGAQLMPIYHALGDWRVRLRGQHAAPEGVASAADD